MSVQNPSWLFDIGDDVHYPVIYGDYFITQCKDPRHEPIRIQCLSFTGVWFTLLRDEELHLKTQRDVLLPSGPSVFLSLGDLEVLFHDMQVRRMLSCPKQFGSNGYHKNI